MEYEVDMDSGGEAEQVLHGTEMESAAEKVIDFLLENRISVGTIISVPAHIRSGYAPFQMAAAHPDMVTLRGRLKTDRNFRALLYEKISRHPSFGSRWASKIFAAFEN